MEAPLLQVKVTAVKLEVKESTETLLSSHLPEQVQPSPRDTRVLERD